MMSNSNYSIGLQRLKPVHTAYCRLHNLAENWSWARQVNGRDWNETSASRDRDETLVRLETETSRPRPQPWYETTTVTCHYSSGSFDKLAFDSREHVGRIIRPALLKSKDSFTCCGSCWNKENLCHRRFRAL